MASISLQNVCVNFPVYGVSSRSLKKQLIRISTGGKFGATDNNIISVKALDNVTINIEHGDRLGLIGHNGSGKSTLLKVITGICEPNVGSCKVDGKVSALLDVFLGMDPESTGYENIMLRGIISGFTRKEILTKKDEIAEFTELGDYLSLPVRTYSSGMQLRLAFGIATAVFPEVLVLDEVVGAGDAAFMKKAEERFELMVKTSHIVVLASHDIKIIEKLCNKLLWLDAGKVAFYGSISDGVQKYIAALK
jgi:ABC-2 type transport system ATP-binding protein